MARLVSVSIGNSMISSDISKLVYLISRAVRRVKFETVLKYHEWYLCQMSRTNHAIICLYYCLKKICNFHMQVFQINLKYHCFEPIKLQKFLIKQYKGFNSKFLTGIPSRFRWESPRALYTNIHCLHLEQALKLYWRK